MPLILAALLLLATPAWAGQIDATWTAPTTNTDGSALQDLASYRLYWFLFPNTPCPGTQFVVVNSPTPTPAPNTTVGAKLTGLTQGMTYNAQVTAVDTGGNESACSLVASGVARADAPLPAGSNLQIAFVNPPPPTGPDFTITGVVAGQTISGPLRVSATATVGTPATSRGFQFALLNSQGVAVSSNAEGAAPYCFVGDTGALPCLPFDTTTTPNGAYTMRVTMTTTTGVVVTKSVPFTVAN